MSLTTLFIIAQLVQKVNRFFQNSMFWIYCFKKQDKICKMSQFSEKLLTFTEKCDIIINVVRQKNDVLVAQLDRVTGYEPVGRGFESLQARH